MGIRPVMAHPERVTSVQQDPSRVERWAAAGWQFQLDLLSLATAYGRHAKRLARALLLDDHYAFTGSDLHRPVQLRELEAARLAYQRLVPDPKP
jgi:protein-tyrosine phosphatase